jgi:hypothetical protein
MKKISIVIIIAILLKVEQSYAQNNKDAVAVAAGAVAGAAIAALAIENYKEQMELHATEYILESQSNIKKFELSLIDFDGVRLSDLSSVSCFSFGIRATDESNLQENKVLLMFVSRGWINEFGIDVARVKWKLLSFGEWDDILFTYVNLASPIKLTDKNNLPVFKVTPNKNYVDNENFFVNQIPAANKNLAGTIETYQKSQEITKIGSINLTSNLVKYRNVDNSGNVKEEIAFPLSKYSGDTYLLKDFSPEFKIIYNENSMGLYIKSLSTLVQLKRSTVNLINSYLH